MIKSVNIENFGPIESLIWDEPGNVNVVVGPNDSGKTFLLKALYCAIRTAEEYKRGQEPNSAEDILFEKMYWTFQSGKIGDLVHKQANGALSFTCRIDGRNFSYSLERDADKHIQSLTNNVSPLSSNSIFLPAKEVLSVHKIILESRRQEKLFGFDDTYNDLAEAIQSPPTRGKNYSEFSNARAVLEKICGGYIDYDNDTHEWFFRKGNSRFAVGVTAEGVKKIGILDVLLGNRYLSPQSTVFMDEPEANLHPAALIQLLDMIAALAERGMQFFLASHSYFVIKKLHLLAREKNISIQLFSRNRAKNEWRCDNLKEKIPSDNEIIAESVQLYEQDLDLAFGE